MLFEFISANALTNGLQICRGQSFLTLYLSLAIKNVGSGRLVLVQRRLKDLRAHNHRIDKILLEFGSEEVLLRIQEHSSLDWSLLQLLQDRAGEQYDFMMIDGGRSCSEVGFACVLGERLIRPGGWIMVSDTRFSFAKQIRRDASLKPKLSNSELSTCQINAVFEIFLKSHPNFTTYRRRFGIGLAQKIEPLWSVETMKRIQRDNLIADVIEQARHDPDFRQELLDHRTSSEWTRHWGNCDEFRELFFCDSDSVITGNMSKKNGRYIVSLDKPSWEKYQSESTLREMLDEI
jgi:hypothetical protein